MNFSPDLFSATPATPVQAPPSRMAGRGIPLRWCQREDADAIIYALERGFKRPCCVGATGIGKGAIISEVAGRLLRETGKVVCLVDRANLVHQLANEIERHLGITCGRVADGEASELYRRCVVSTVQAMYTQDSNGKPMYEYSDFRHVRAVILDEAHKFFAPCFRSVGQHFADQCGAVVVGFTATPVASNGDEWKSFFDWAADSEGPCMRTAAWCIRHGLLVPPRQAFVNVHLDLTAIHERLTGTDDPQDAEDAQDELADALVSLLSDKGERDAARFAAGVADVMGQHRSIIFAPPRVQAAKLIASWLQATNRVTCEPVWGGRADKHEVLREFQRGAPQSLSSVQMLCEGFNCPDVSAVFVCRMLKNWRLIQQMVGRGMRPHPSVIAKINALDGEEYATERRRIIAESVKPFALVADMVGIDQRIIQASAVEVLYADEPDDVKREIGELLRTRATKRDDVEMPTEEVLEEARSQLLLRQHERLREMARQRAMAGEIPAEVSVSYEGGAPIPSAPAPVATATLGEKARFVALATQYETERAVRIAETTNRYQLRGMAASMQKKLDREGGRPDWSRARKAYPDWAKQRFGGAN